MQNLSESKKIDHFIGGQLVKSKSGRFGKVYNPSTGEVIGLCPLASREEVDDAVTKAKLAFHQWGHLSIGKRVHIIQKFKNLLIENIEELSYQIGVECGKTLEDARGEILRGIESVDLAINAPHILKGEYSLNVGGDINAYSIKKPLGVVAAISPFNFPVMVPLAMTSMAVAVGNSVILKPSEKVPYSAIYLSKLWKEAGLPDGVWTVINGDKEAVDCLLSHPDISAISFVGSTKVAEYIYQTGSKYNKRVAAFGGGKNHMVIMPDADIDHAVNAFVGAAYGAASQRCMAISVAMPVGQNTANLFVSKLIEKVKQLKVGPFDDIEADYGPVISMESKEVVLKAVEKSLQEGAKIIVDERDLTIENYENGYFVGPILLDNVTPDMEIYKEEVFGPARIITRVQSLNEAIELINNHQYGNGVTIFTQDGSSARKFTNEIEVGMVGVNVSIPIPVGYYNFGGWKNSKFGESHMFGPDNARFYTKSKTISEKWLENSGNREQLNFSFPTN